MMTKATNYIVELLIKKGYVFRLDDIIRGVGEPKNVYVIHQKDEDINLYDVRYYDLEGKWNGAYIGRAPLSILRVLESKDAVLVNYKDLDDEVYNFVHIRAIASEKGVKIETTQSSECRCPNIMVSGAACATVAALTVKRGEVFDNTQKLVDIAAAAYYDRVCKEMEQDTKQRLETLKINLKLD